MSSLHSAGSSTSETLDWFDDLALAHSSWPATLNMGGGRLARTLKLMALATNANVCVNAWRSEVYLLHSSLYAGCCSFYQAHISLYMIIDGNKLKTGCLWNLLLSFSVLILYNCTVLLYNKSVAHSVKAAWTKSYRNELKQRTSSAGSTVNTTLMNQNLSHVQLGLKVIWEKEYSLFFQKQLFTHRNIKFLCRNMWT